MTDRTLSSDIALRPWSESDLPLLERLLGDPAMTEHLGGPESLEQIRRRHERYCTMDSTTGRMFVIVAGSTAEPVGSIGYWEKEWGGTTVWETGWSVLPEFQGQGIATRAIAAILEHVRTVDGPRSLHAFPSVDNAPSNAICRKAGFALVDAVDFEYPPGHMMHCNDWAIDLREDSPGDQGNR